MAARPLIHPRMLARIGPQFWPSRCAIQDVMVTQDSFGEEQRTYTTVIGLESIPCTKAPISFDSPLGLTENSRGNLTEFRTVQHVTLQGAYPTITEHMRAVIDGETYDIVGAETDSHTTQTRIKVQQVEL